MTWVDAVVFVVLGVSALLAFMRGFVREALGIAAWVGAAYTASRLYDVAIPTAHRFIANPEIANPVAFGAVFIAALIVLSIVASLLARGVRAWGLGGLDRSIGLLFGVARGAALVSATYIVAELLFSVAQWPEAVLHARSLPFAYQGARWIVAELPPPYAPTLDAPPEGAAADSGALLQSTPRGYARGHVDQESR